MQLLLLLVVCVAFIPFNSEPVAGETGRLVLATWLGVLGMGFGAEIAARIIAWRLRTRPLSRAITLRLYHYLRLGHLLLVVGFYFYALFRLEWGAIVRTGWGIDRHVPILLGDLLVLAPFITMVLLAWLSFYRVERALADAAGYAGDQPFWSRWTYLSFHARHYLGLVLAPILLFKSIQETLGWAFADQSEELWFSLLSIAALMAAVLLVTPWLLTRIWKARPLPAGPLRARLENLARRLGFRYTEILVWDTRGGMANAMVTGMFAIPRYVLLSDGLLHGLSEDEIEAVFGHEIGHVKHHHMPLYVGFAALSVLCLGMLGNLALGHFDSLLAPMEASHWRTYLQDWQQHAQVWLSCLGGVAALGCYVWLVFGFLSRRCERQADVFGCKAVSCGNPHCTGHEAPLDGMSTRGLCPTGVRTFIQALERVADLNGIRRDKPSWRHSSIARRVAFLEKLLVEPAAEPRFQRRLVATKVLLLAALAALCALLVWHGGNLADALRLS